MKEEIYFDMRPGDGSSGMVDWLVETVRRNMEAAVGCRKTFEAAEKRVLGVSCLDVRHQLDTRDGVHKVVGGMLGAESVALVPMRNFGAGGDYGRVAKILGGQGYFRPDEDVVLAMPHFHGLDVDGGCVEGCGALKTYADGEVMQQLPGGLANEVRGAICAPNIRGHVRGLGKRIRRAGLGGLVIPMAHGDRQVYPELSESVGQQGRRMQLSLVNNHNLRDKFGEVVGLPLTVEDVSHQHAPIVGVEIGTDLVQVGGLPTILRGTDEPWSNPFVTTEYDVRQVRAALYRQAYTLVAQTHGDFDDLRGMVVSAPREVHGLVVDTVNRIATELRGSLGITNRFPGLVTIDSAALRRQLNSQ